MKITALLLLSTAGDCSSSSGPSDPVVLANASDVSHFGYFQRKAAKEFILFIARTVAKRTPHGQRQSVQHEGFLPDIWLHLPSSCQSKVHSYNRNGLCALAFMDDHYPVRKVRGIANSKDSVLMQGLVHGRQSVHGHPKAQSELGAIEHQNFLFDMEMICP
ncbi:hypothetical protein BHE74_00044041 [Ensete ventricosum]|nr:hypothetical protein GW17_00054025 [Ensete ventricosum]RWW49749.1 hypothetical protein BHE74_00044041 [Ensete ventricosum]